MKYSVLVTDVVLQGDIKVEADTKEEAVEKAKQVFDKALRRSERWGIWLCINDAEYVKHKISTDWYAYGEDE